MSTTLWAAAALGWALVGFVAMGLLDRVPEQGGCYEPRLAAGVTVVTLAVLGVVVALWVVRARRQPLGVALTAALIVVVILTMLLTPEARFGTC